MATYLILNSVFVLGALLLAVYTRTISLFKQRSWWVMLAVMLLLTAVFDNIFIAFDIFWYDTSKLLGIYVGLAPIEDFCYTLLAAILLPTLWRVRNGTPARSEKDAAI